VLVLFMALPFFVESAPRAYRLKAGNADLPYFNIDRDIPAFRSRPLFTIREWSRPSPRPYSQRPKYDAPAPIRFL
jgi:hypothetical protein